MKQVIINILTIMIALGVGFSSYPFDQLNILAAHGNLDMFQELEHESLEHVHSHKHSNSDDDSHNHEHNSNDSEGHEHQHQHQHVVGGTYLQYTHFEGIQIEHKFTFMTRFFAYRDLTFGHYPSEILRPPIFLLS